MKRNKCSRFFFVSKLILPCTQHEVFDYNGFNIFLTYTKKKKKENEKEKEKNNKNIRLSLQSTNFIQSYEVNFLKPVSGKNSSFVPLYLDGTEKESSSHVYKILFSNLLKLVNGKSINLHFILYIILYTKLFENALNKDISIYNFFSQKYNFLFNILVSTRAVNFHLENDKKLILGIDRYFT